MLLSYNTLLSCYYHTGAVICANVLVRDDGIIELHKMHVCICAYHHSFPFLHAVHKICTLLWIIFSKP